MAQIAFQTMAGGKIILAAGPSFDKQQRKKQIANNVMRSNSQRSTFATSNKSVNRGLVRAPAAQNKSSRQTGRNSTRYRECERVGTVNGSLQFEVVANFACNPGLKDSFPWLSSHADLYEKYKIHKLVYRYKNLKGTGAGGNIIMSFDYDTLDAPPSSAIEMCQSTVWTDGAPWRIFELHVPVDSKAYYTRPGLIPGTDLKTYDMGRLFVAAEGSSDASGSTDTSPQGILEVEYDIELMEKQPASLGINPVQHTCSMFFNNDYQTFPPTAAIEAQPIVWGLPVFNPLNIKFAEGDTTKTLLVMPLGVYKLTTCITLQNGSTSGQVTDCFVHVSKNATTGSVEYFSQNTGAIVAGSPFTDHASVTVIIIFECDEGDDIIVTVHKQISTSTLQLASNYANLIIERLS